MIPAGIGTGCGHLTATGRAAHDAKIANRGKSNHFFIDRSNVCSLHGREILHALVVRGLQVSKTLVSQLDLLLAHATLVHGVPDATRKDGGDQRAVDVVTRNYKAEQ